MNTKVNNISFQANVQTLVKTKNPNAFKTVCKEFERCTSNYPNDTLYITRNKTGAYSWHISNKKSGDYFKGEEIFTNSIDEHIDEQGEKNFAKELVNAFKAMKLERKIYKLAKPVKNELDKTVRLYQTYKNNALIYKEDGNKLMCDRYSYLADRTSQKISKLKSQYDKYVNDFKSKINEYSKEFPEISQVELYLS